MTIIYNAPIGIGANFSVYRGTFSTFYYFPRSYELARDPKTSLPQQFTVTRQERTGELIYTFQCEPLMPNSTELASVQTSLQQRFGNHNLWPYQPDLRDKFDNPALTSITSLPLRCQAKYYGNSFWPFFNPVRCTAICQESLQSDMSKAFQSNLGWAGRLDFSFVAGWAKFHCRLRSALSHRPLCGEFYTLKPGPDGELERVTAYQFYDGDKPGNLFYTIEKLLSNGKLTLDILDNTNPSREDRAAACAQILVERGHIFLATNPQSPLRYTDPLSARKPPDDEWDDATLDVDWLFFTLRPATFSLAVRANNVPAILFQSTN